MLRILGMNNSCQVHECGEIPIEESEDDKKKRTLVNLSDKTSRRLALIKSEILYLKAEF